MPGNIPLDSKHAAQINDQALEKAAAFLEATAADLEQMAVQGEQEKRPIYRGGALAQASENRGKARLLRGQASHIRVMKLNLK